MDPTHKLLPTELAAIVHHVELNRSGWWDKAMHRLILASVWLDDNNPTIVDVQTILKKEFRLSINIEKIKSVLVTLEAQNFLVRLPEDRFRIPDEKRSFFEGEIESAENSGRDAKAYFCDLARDLCKDLSPDDVWSKFETFFLAPLIRETGANAYKLIVGEEMTVNKDLVHQFQNKFGQTNKTQLFDLVSKFLDPTNEAVRSYISRMLHATFCVAASGLPDTVITKLIASTGQQIRFRIFVDTNCLFSILALHDNPSNAAATELKEIIDSLNSNLKIDLYVTPRTIDEAKRSILAAKERLAGFPTGTNFTKPASHAGFSGLDAKFMDARAKKSGKLSPEDWFDPYLNDFVLLAQNKGVKLFNEKLDNYSVRQDVIDDISIISETEKSRTPRGKSYEMIRHDVILWHFVNDNRPSYVESPIDARDWILTLDFRLIGFDGRKREAQRPRVPICVHPTSLIQLLQFWVPRTKEFEEAILGSMRLPFLFQEFDVKAEHTSLRILKSMGRFEGSEQISEETISRVMLNEGLRARLDSGENESIEAELIRDALVEEMKDITEKEKQRADKLDNKVKAQDSKILTLSTETEDKKKEIEGLRKRATVEAEKAALAETEIEEQGKKIQAISERLSISKLSQARMNISAIYLLLLGSILVISGPGASWLAGIVHPLTILVGTIPFRVFLGIVAFVFLHLILEVFVKRQTPMNQLWEFRQISKFRKWLWSFVILMVVVGIFANIAANNIQKVIGEQSPPAPSAVEEKGVE